MKKIITLSVCALFGLSAFAQLTVLKEAEKTMKNKAPMKEVVKVVTPAFTDPETATMAQTWYIPGKAAFNEFDELFKLKAFNKLPANGEATMGHNLIDGYGYMVKALELDPVTDAKGKVKTKYTKEILGVLAGHYNDYNNSAIELYNMEDFAGAVKAWDIYLDMTENAANYKGIIAAPDSTQSIICYNQALAAWNAKDYQKSLSSFIRAKDKGYKEKHIYDYAISVAAELGDTTMIVALSKEAFPIYGKENPTYIQFIINDFLNKKDYVNAHAAIKEAIAAYPDNSDYYFILGVIYDSEGKRPQAQESYKKSLNINPDSELANFYLGKSYCDEAYLASENAPSSIEEYNKEFDNVIKPLFEQALVYLRKAYEINDDNRDVQNYLQNVYYNLKDETNLKALEKLHPELQKY